MRFNSDLINKTITAIKVKYEIGFSLKKHQGRKSFLRNINESSGWETSAQRPKNLHRMANQSEYPPVSPHS